MSATGEDVRLVKIPERCCPGYVSGASFDPDTLRTAAEFYCKNHAISGDFTVKPWVVLYLLDVWEAAQDAATSTVGIHGAQERLLRAFNG